MTPCPPSTTRKKIFFNDDMSKKSESTNNRARMMLAQEAARIIVEQGVDDYRAAKTKAAERLGFTARGSLPGNGEIEQALSEHLQLFHADSHTGLLRKLRAAALSAMDLLSAFEPRLVGSVLAGTAGTHSTVNLHVFSDSVEQVADRLHLKQIPNKLYERRLKSRRGQAETYAGYRFMYQDASIEATVFPFDGLRQAPISSIDGKPMRRADARSVQAMLIK